MGEGSSVESVMSLLRKREAEAVSPIQRRDHKKHSAEAECFWKFRPKVEIDEYALQELLAILGVRQVLFAPHDMPHRLSLGVLAIPFDIVNIV